jgi:transposase
MECPKCGVQVEPYWRDGWYVIGGLSYYKCDSCGFDWDSDYCEESTEDSKEGVDAKS